MAADTYDVVTLAEVKPALNIAAADTAFDVDLQALITACSRQLDHLCGPIVQRTVTAEAYDGGDWQVWLKSRPLASVTQVVEYDNTTAGTLTAETNTTKTTTNYVVNLTNGRLKRRNSNVDAVFPNGYGNVVVTYAAGRAANTAAVDAKFKNAAITMLQNYWRSHQQSQVNLAEFDFANNTFPHFAVPNAVKEMLADEWQVGSGAVG